MCLLLVHIATEPMVNQNCFQSAQISRTHASINWLGCTSSPNQLTRIAHDYSHYCSSPLFIKKETQENSCIHSQTRLAGHKSFFWKSLPRLPKRNYLVNDKMFHGYIFSGMQCTQSIAIALPMAQVYVWLPRYLIETSWICVLPTLKSWGNGIIRYYQGARKWWWRMVWHLYTYWRLSWVAQKCQGYGCCVRLWQKSQGAMSWIYHTATWENQHQTDLWLFWPEQSQVPIRIHTHDGNMLISKMVKVQHKEDGVLYQKDKWHVLKKLEKQHECYFLRSQI